MLAVIDGVEKIEAQQFGQSASIDLVVLVAFLHALVLSRIAHLQFPDVRSQQIVQPGSRGSFFKGDVQISPQPVEKLQNHARFCFDDRFHHHLAERISGGNRNTFLVHIHPDIFNVATLHSGTMSHFSG